jgi:hypothetical protein
MAAALSVAWASVWCVSRQGVSRSSNSSMAAEVGARWPPIDSRRMGPGTEQVLPGGDLAGQLSHAGAEGGVELM